MGLTITLYAPVEDFPDEHHEFYNASITHNLGRLAGALGVYHVLWRPEENKVRSAKNLIPHLAFAIENLSRYPNYFKAYGNPKGWGKSEDFLLFMKNLLENCRMYPDARVKARR